jgi:hypothetical protein
MNGIIGHVADRNRPAVLSGAGLEFHDSLHDLLPRPRDHLGIGAHQVSAGDLEVQERLPVGLVARVEQRRGLLLVAGLQTLLFARGVVLDEVDSGRTPEQPVFVSQSLAIVLRGYDRPILRR